LVRDYLLLFNQEWIVGEVVSAFQITDVLGRVRFSIDIPPGGNYFVFPLKNLDEGLYVCKIAGKNISLTKKLVVIK